MVKTNSANVDVYYTDFRFKISWKISKHKANNTNQMRCNLSTKKTSKKTVSGSISAVLKAGLNNIFSPGECLQFWGGNLKPIMNCHNNDPYKEQMYV